MAIEIERKFLVLNESWKSKYVKKEFLRDGLIATEESRKVRVRTYDDRATLTIKGLKVGLKREEYEYEIPLKDAEDLFTRHCGGRILEKTRFYVPYLNHMWTIDTYHGLLEGQIIAEIELPLEQTRFDAPDWLGEEVTHDRRYSKINLLKQKSVAETKVVFSKPQEVQSLEHLN
ncbi:MAG: CYTH domain-containing protein [Hyphomicrobium sp.]